uniref:NET domain-containing protein n=1 Tax=Ditylum brightwellii TaxID=49249 RepID=A0A7S4SJ03_9STRA
MTRTTRSVAAKEQDATKPPSSFTRSKHSTTTQPVAVVASSPEKKRRISPTKREKEIPTDDSTVESLTPKEEENLAEAINQLSSYELSGVIQIISESSSSSVDNIWDEIDMDIGQLDAATQRKLQHYVRMLRTSASEKEEKKETFQMFQDTQNVTEAISEMSSATSTPAPVPEFKVEEEEVKSKRLEDTQNVTTQISQVPSATPAPEKVEEEEKKPLALEGKQMDIQTCTLQK